MCRQVVHRLSPLFGGGVTSFQRHCFPNPSSTESDECKAAFGGKCIRCCDSNLCNNGSIDIENPTTSNNRTYFEMSTVDRVLVHCVFLYLILVFVNVLNNLDIYISATEPTGKRTFYCIQDDR